MKHEEALDKEEEEEEKGDQGTPQPVDSTVIDEEAEAKAQIHSAKRSKILEACRRRDIEELQSLAESPGGFLTDGLRQQACELKLFYVCQLPIRITRGYLFPSWP